MTVTDETTVVDRDSIIQSCIGTGAYLGWRRYRQFFTISDARQEASEWVLGHPRMVDELLADGPRGERRLQSRIIAHVARAGRAEKAHRSGYDADDEAFYSGATIELVLPVLWDEDYRPWRPEEAAGRAQKGGRVYLAWETMVVDVRNAWEKADLTTEERAAVALRFGDHLILTQIATVLAVSEGTVRNRLRSALRAIQAELGGPRPRGCGEDGCLTCDHVGSRRAMSNAQAMAVMAHQYEE